MNSSTRWRIERTCSGASKIVIEDFPSESRAEIEPPGRDSRRGRADHCVLKLQDRTVSITSVPRQPASEPPPEQPLASHRLVLLLLLARSRRYQPPLPPGVL